MPKQKYSLTSRASQLPVRVLNTISISFLVFFILFIVLTFLPGFRLLPAVYAALMLIFFLKTRQEARQQIRTEQKSIPPVPDIPLPRPAKKQPEKKKEPDDLHIHPAYATRLKTLKDLARQVDEREDSVSEFLDDFFGQSEISKTRYQTIMKDAEKVTANNYTKASQAVKVFGSATAPSTERLEILDRYIRDSRDVLEKVEKVVDQLILADQSGVLKSASQLDLSLEELARTTSYYTAGKERVH